MVEIDTVISQELPLACPAQFRCSLLCRGIDGGFLICLPHCAGSGDGFLGVMSAGLFFEIGRCSTGCGVEVATPNAITVRGTVKLWAVGQALIRSIG